LTKWPDGKSFAFAIFDDTDNATVENVSPVYELLSACHIKATKSVWIYPPRDHFAGECLEGNRYLDFIRLLQHRGFEIALHGVGSGEFCRDEIIKAINRFYELIGHYPYLHTNHARNYDSIYWGNKRFVPPLSWIYRLYQKQAYLGDDIDSDYYWGDLSKKHIEYMRNRVFRGINTGRYDPWMPYRERAKEGCSNYWFSSSDGHTVKEFTDLISKKNIDRLETESGFSIVYTHFASGFSDENGLVNQEFRKNIIQLSKRNGWFVPVGELLDFLISEDKRGRRLSYYDSLALDIKWIGDRIWKKWKYGR